MKRLLPCVLLALLLTVSGSGCLAIHAEEGCNCLSKQEREKLAELIAAKVHERQRNDDPCVHVKDLSEHMADKEVAQADDQ